MSATATAITTTRAQQLARLRWMNFGLLRLQTKQIYKHTL